jgi:DNA-binding NarL/FixJ family response regulator
MNKITLYIADDHQIVIDGLCLLLNDHPHFTIVGTANNGTMAFQDIQRLKPDLAILDLRMPEKDGIHILKSMKEKKLQTKVIILSMHADKRFINDAKRMDAQGYLLKNTGKAELITAINHVMEGKTYFVKTPSVEQEEGALTPRETDILKLVTQGLTNQQIADKLSLSHYTIETHRKNILRKTGCKNLATLIAYALEKNIS